MRARAMVQLEPFGSGAELLGDPLWYQGLPTPWHTPSHVRAARRALGVPCAREVFQQRVRASLSNEIVYVPPLRRPVSSMVSCASGARKWKIHSAALVVVLMDVPT